MNNNYIFVVAPASAAPELAEFSEIPDSISSVEMALVTNDDLVSLWAATLDREDDIGGEALNGAVYTAPTETMVFSLNPEFVSALAGVRRPEIKSIAIRWRRSEPSIGLNLTGLARTIHDLKKLAKISLRTKQPILLIAKVDY